MKSILKEDGYTLYWDYDRDYTPDLLFKFSEVSDYNVMSYLQPYVFRHRELL